MREFKDSQSEKDIRSNSKVIERLIKLIRPKQAKPLNYTLTA
jgi:hypothetical protein